MRLAAPPIVKTSPEPARPGAPRPIRPDPVAGAQTAAAARHAAARLRTPRPRKHSALAQLLMHLRPLTWAYLDFLVLAAAGSLLQRTLASTPGFAWVAGPWTSGLAYGACITIAGLVFGLYERETLQARSRIFVRTGLALALGTVLAYAWIHLVFYGVTTRWLGVWVCAVYAASAIPLRLAAHELITSRRRRLLCVGHGPSIQKVQRLLAHALRPHLELVGHLRGPHERRPPGQPPADFRAACPCLGGLAEIARILRDYQVDEVVVGAELSRDPAVSAAVMTCLEHRCRVTDQPTFIEKLLGEVPAGDINAQWFLVADVQTGGGYDTVKRAVDLLAAGTGLLLTLPLWGLIALAIRIDSRGPLFLHQRRVGQHGREFTIHKFRTMVPDAERHGARWADRADPRVTRCGRLLRRSRLDELPQLWNILRGEMSLVGPRPERPEFVHQLTAAIPHYQQRHLIKPGLTGWAQIYLGYGATVEDARRKLCYDLYYLKHRSIDLDFAILIRTVGTFLIGAR